MSVLTRDLIIESYRITGLRPVCGVDLSGKNGACPIRAIALAYPDSSFLRMDVLDFVDALDNRPDSYGLSQAAVLGRQIRSEILDGRLVAAINEVVVS